MSRPSCLIRLEVLFAAYLLLLTSCFNKNDTLVKRTSIVMMERATENGVTTGTYNPASTVNQTLVVNEGVMSGSRATFQPGALAVSTKISIQEGVDIATPALAGNLAVANGFKASGPAVAVTAAQDVDPIKPFTIAIPLPSSTPKLFFADAYEKLVVTYAIKIAETGETLTGIMPRSALTLTDTHVKFDTLHFGVFQAALTFDSIKDELKAGSAVITVQTKVSQKSLEPMSLTARSPFVVRGGKTITLTGKHLRPTIRLALNGKSITSLNLASDTSLSFTAPGDVNTGLVKLTAEQEGTSQDVSLVFDGTGDYPVFSQDKSKICSDIKFYDLNGALQTGTRNCSGTVVADCNSDGEVGCKTTNAVKAAVVAQIAPADLKAGKSIAGVVGTATLESHSSCSMDGASSCVVDGVDYKAAKMANFTAANITTGIKIAGVDGIGAGETHSSCTSNGQIGCVTTSSFKAADLTNLVSGNIKNGVAIAGLLGTYPSLASPLAGATSTSDLITLEASTPAGTYEFFDSTGLRYIGSIIDIGTIAPGATSQTFADGLYRQFNVAGDSNLNAANIKNSVTVFGVTGALAEAPVNCSANAEVGCVTTATFMAADLSNLSAENIKKNVVLAGVTGDYPSTTYPLVGASSGVADLPAFTATTGGTSYEWFASDGSRFTGAIEADETVTPGITNQTINVGLYRSVTVSGDADLTASNIKNAVNIFGVTGNVVPSAANCSLDGEVGCVTTLSYRAADMMQAIPSNIKIGVVIAGATGVLSGAPVNCSANGQQGCVTTSTYKAADLSNLLSANIKNGVTIAGTAGTYPSLATPLVGASGVISDLTSMAANAPAGNYEFFDSTGARYTGNIADAGTIAPGTSTQNFSASVYRQFSVAGDADLVADNIKSGASIFGITGTQIPAPANCTADAQLGCVTTATYKAVNMGAFSASDLKTGKIVAGISGTLANCIADGSSGCVTTATYKAVNMASISPGNIKSGVSIAGIPGDYPSATYPLRDASGTPDLESGTFNAKIKSSSAFEYWDSAGVRYAGAGDNNLTAMNIVSGSTIFGTMGGATVESHTNCLTDGGTGCVTTSAFPAANAAVALAANIKAGVQIAGVAGAYPSATFPLTGADATADLDGALFDAQIKNPALFEWFDSKGNRHTKDGDADINATNIINGVTIFGVSGTAFSGPNCSADGELGCVTAGPFKAANTSLYGPWDVRKGKAPGGVAGKIAFFKNMADLTNFDRASGIGSTPGLDPFDSIDDDNNGIFPTQPPVPSWDVANGSNWTIVSAGIFRDELTGLVWTQDDGSNRNWGNSITYCNGKTDGGTTAGGWRLPTQKEMLQAYTNGIWSLKGTAQLKLNNGSFYWAATTLSTNSNNAWGVDLSSGKMTYDTKSFSIRALCGFGSNHSKISNT